MFTSEEWNTRREQIGERLGTDEGALTTLSEMEADRNEAVTAAATWEQRYNDLAGKYRSRFFTGADDIKNQQTMDVRKDTRTTETADRIRIEDLFKQKEGM